MGQSVGSGGDQMKVFTCDQFTGFYPVGTAAVVVAHDKKEARKKLEGELTYLGLEQKVPLKDIKTIDTALPGGDYSL